MRARTFGPQQQDSDTGNWPTPATAAQQRNRPRPNLTTPATQTQSKAALGNSSNDKQGSKSLQYPSSTADQSDYTQQLINLAADQQEQAEATSSSLRTMIQKMIDAQNVLRHWRSGMGTDTGIGYTVDSIAGTSIRGPISPSGSSRNSPASGRASPGSGRRSPGSNIRTPHPSPSQQPIPVGADASSAAQQALQLELYATKAKLSRALSALTKLQAAYQQQQATAQKLEQQLQEYTSTKQTGRGDVGASAESSAESKLPGLLSALAMVAGAGVASTRLSAQQQELQDQLVAAENIEKQLKSELEAKGEQLQTLKKQVALELNELQGVTTQQAAQLSQLTQLLEDSQAQLTATRIAQAATQEQLQKHKADYAAQAAELKSLHAALSIAREAASNMRWELLTKEAALSTLSKQLADAEDTSHRAAAAQADLLQQKEAAIAALLEKLDLQEAAAAAESAWADDQLRSSKASAQELHERLEGLQAAQQQQAEAEQVPQLLQSQQPKHGPAEANQQEQDLPPAVLARLRKALLDKLAQQLQSLRQAHMQQQQRLHAAVPSTDKQPADAAGTSPTRLGQVLHSSTSSRDSAGSAFDLDALAAMLQKLVGDNSHLAEQLTGLLLDAEEQRRQHATAVAARVQQSMEQAELLQQAEQKLHEQTARVSAVLGAAATAAAQQQEDSVQLQQLLQQQQQQQAQLRMEGAAGPGQQQLQKLETVVSAMLQEVQDAMLQLRQDGAWAFPTTQGVVDLSVPQLVQQYQRMMQAHMNEGLPAQQTSQAASVAAADAFMEAYFQVKDRDKALHTLQSQLIGVKQQLSELLAMQQVNGIAAQQGVAQAAAASSTPSGTIKQLEARIEKLRNNNFQLSESLTAIRRQKAAVEGEAAAAKQHAELLMQQLLSAEPGAAAAAEALSEQLQRELEDARTDLSVLEGKLAVAIVHKEAAAAEKVKLQHRLAAAEAAAAADKLVLGHRIAAAEAAVAYSNGVQEQQQKQLGRLQRQLQQQQEAVQTAAMQPIEQQEDVSSVGSSTDLFDSTSSTNDTVSSTENDDTVQDITISIADIHTTVQEQPMQAAEDTAATSLGALPLESAAAAAPDSPVDDMTTTVPLHAPSKLNTKPLGAQPELQDALQLLTQVKQQLEQRDKTIAQLQQRLAEGRSARQHRQQELQMLVTTQQDAGPEAAATAAGIAAVGTDGELKAEALSAADIHAEAHVQDIADAVAAGTTADVGAALVGSSGCDMQAALEGVIAAVNTSGDTETAHEVDVQAAVVPAVIQPASAESLMVEVTAATADAVPPANVATAAVASDTVMLPPQPAAVAQTAAAAANAGIGGSSSRAELMGSGLSMALLAPLVSQLHCAQRSEEQLLAAKSKVCQVLGLVAGTEAALVQTQSQVLALQQRLWEVAGWRALLVVAWQLQETEGSLAADVAALQKLEELQQQQQEADEEAACAPLGQTASSADHGRTQQKEQDTAHNAFIAELIGWEGPAAAAAEVEKSRAKVGKLLSQLADRQAELARLQRHVQRLAAILMAGVDDEVLGQLQKQLEAQIEQTERSRVSVAQQVQGLQQQEQEQQPESKDSAAV